MCTQNTLMNASQGVFPRRHPQLPPQGLCKASSSPIPLRRVTPHQTSLGLCDGEAGGKRGATHPLLYDLVLWVLTNSFLAGSWCCFSPEFSPNHPQDDLPDVHFGPHCALRDPHHRDPRFSANPTKQLHSLLAGWANQKCTT